MRMYIGYTELLNNDERMKFFLCRILPVIDFVVSQHKFSLRLVQFYEMLFVLSYLIVAGANVLSIVDNLFTAHWYENLNATTQQMMNIM